MNASGSPSPALPVAPPRDRVRFWAVLAAALFLPAAAGAGILTLASERASRCVTYGEPCASGLPGWLFGWGAALGVLALVLALAAPAVRVRRAALAVQVCAECVALLVIVSYA
ncbi:hypothetical protein GCM10010302_09060 [Streptomyces polychromogenes]|uniref:Uncharacterized protein n=1 Tax=Streptomyces polychromogenes TaxID=67342 RepID=A0ABN0V3Q9_9ACTN